MNPLTIFRRAFNSNLATITVSESERESLESAGWREPVVQRYFVWRRALLMVVMMATILSAGLATYCDYTETGEEPNVIDSLKESVMEGLENATSQDADTLATEVNEAKTTVTAKQHAEAEEDEENAKDEPEIPETAFSKFTDLVHTASLYAMPVAALLALFLRRRFSLSFKVLAIGFALSFFVPIAIALCPWNWFGYVEEKISPDKEPMKFLENTAESALQAGEYLAMLLPAVLALIPGVLRACLRVKTLLPGSLLSGWFIVMAAPLYGLFLLATFVAINQVTNDPYLIGGLVLLVIAHLVYAVRAASFTAPLISEADFARMKNSQRMIGILTLSAGVLVIVYMATREFLGIHIVGKNPKHALLQPLDLLGYGIEIISRSMFVTVLGADLFVRMNLAAWKHHRLLAQSHMAETHDSQMQALADAAG